MEREKLLSYLSAVIDLERAREALKKEKKRLEEQVIPSYGIPLEIRSDYVPQAYKSMKDVLGGDSILKDIVEMLGVCIMVPISFAVLSVMVLVLPYYMGKLRMGFGEAMVEAVADGFGVGLKTDVLMILAIVLKYAFTARHNKNVSARNEKNRALDQAAVRQAQELDQKRVEAEKEYCKKHIMPHHAFVCEHLARVEAQLAELYAEDVVYGSYRGLIPVTQIYEYIASGICCELTGPNGAYAQYLNDIRADRIIGKLDQVEKAMVSRLDQMLVNQHALIMGIQETNRILSGIENEMNAISDQICNTNRLLEGIERNSIQASRYLEQSQQVLEGMSREIDRISYNSAVDAFNHYVLSCEQRAGGYHLRYPKLRE